MAARASLDTVAYPSAPTLLVLHALRLKGFAEPEVVAGLTRLSTADVERELDCLNEDDLVSRRDGRISGWTLTPAGRDEHDRCIAEELEAAGEKASVDDAYRTFLSLNGELLSLCTAWQMREQPNGEPLLNDHADPAYDAAIVARLGVVHDRVTPVCDALAASLDRFGTYLPRLSAARDRVAGGDVEWLTRPLIDSYHTVWFELHEDLLVTLGLERKEGET